ncbi:MAG: NAD(P)-dependent glycerol-3-phosphate dehydrogenase [Deltaproteobacteria bacterium]|nr:NAD(P)-dependent glycerol-3-phosphate dehydrogenase [Deltaproteobacteria bacterium]
MAKGIAVVGAGGWGIALATVLADKRDSVALWCHGTENFRELTEQRESLTYLPGIPLASNIEISRSLAQVVADKELVICAVPSHAARSVMSEAAASIGQQAIVLCGTKGLEEQTLKTMGEMLGEIFGPERKSSLAFLSGPTFALEVAKKLPAAVTVAASAEAVAARAQEMLNTESLRVYTSADIVGVQMGGVIKNVIAIAAGVSDGLGLGQNARAALITRGLAEMTRLAVRMGAEPMTLAGLPGLGDLILTCAGDLSRNRRFGLQIAQGNSLQDIIGGTRMVAEGVRNTQLVHQLARRLGVDMPIVEQMHAVLYQGKTPAAAVRDLMQRSLKPEIA